MLKIRPDLQAAYDSLCYQGQQFLESHHITQLECLTFEHPKKGTVPIEIDADVLAMQGMVYAADPTLRAALDEYGIDAHELESANSPLSGYLNLENEPLVWGFSGYATGGINSSTGDFFSYHNEAAGLLKLYDYLSAKDELPSLVIDGGVSEGFLALNSIVAESANVPTLGFIPREGLTSVGIRKHLIIAGNTYRVRETFVATADILVCAGGAEGTERECTSAVGRGAAAMILDLADYPPRSLPNTFQANQVLRQAFDDGRLVVCKTYDKIPDSIDQVLRIGTRSGRSARKKVITKSLPRS